MFSSILRSQSKENEVVSVTPKVQGVEESQAQQSSMDSTEVHSSITRSAQEDPVTPPAKIARFEMETSSSKTWEFPAGLADFINGYMTHHVTENEVKEKILMENPVLSNKKGKAILDKLILENKRKLTINHEEALKSIDGKVSHVFAPLLQLWGIMEEALQVKIMGIAP